MKIKSIFFIWLLLFISVLFSSFSIGTVNAGGHTFQDGFTQLGTALQAGHLTGSNITEQNVLAEVVKWLLSFVAVLALTALIIGGITYIVSFGSETRAATAKKMILYAIIGLIVVGLSFSILLAIETVFTNIP